MPNNISKKNNLFLNSFLDIVEEDPLKKEVEQYCKISTLKSGSFKIKYLKQPHVFLKYSLFDLDGFGPIDKFLRYNRKRQVHNHLNLEDKVLLDIGCGRQASLGWDIKENIKRYIGLDRDLPKGQYDNITLIKDVAENVSKVLSPDSIDIITMLAVIEHVEYPKKVLQDCYDILKPGGVLLITTPPPYSDILLKMLAQLRLIDKSEIEEHKNYFYLYDLTNIAEKIGFNTLTSKKFLLGFNNLLIFKRT